MEKHYNQPKFRLDDINCELEIKPQIIRHYSMKSSHYESQDNTFFGLFCGCNKECKCDGEYKCNPQAMGGEACGCDNKSSSHTGPGGGNCPY